MMGFFQRELSIIDFTLNYPPIRNNFTSASLLSTLIETDYLNYPPIRNNLTSASLLSMIIEMDYNLLGMKARTVPRYRAEICRARNIFFLSRSTKRCNSVFFSLCHLQIVLLTIANTKIHYFFYRNNDFTGDLTCVRGRKASAVPCLATCVIFLTVDYWNICPGCIFTRIHGTDDS